jgi:hypothetical protein
VHSQQTKNGAHVPIWRVAGGPRQSEYREVTVASLGVCDPGPVALGMAKMALWPSEKRQLPPFFVPILPIFSGFFCELGDQGANWRRSDPEKRWNGFPEFAATGAYSPVGPTAGMSGRTRSVAAFAALVVSGERWLVSQGKRRPLTPHILCPQKADLPAGARERRR